MNKDEFKKRIVTFGDGLVDKCFPCDSGVVNKIVNTTCKYIVKTKVSELDPVIGMFADKDGDVNVKDFVDYMQDNLIGDGLRINFRDYVDEHGALSRMLPDKTLVIKRDDLLGFLS